MIANQTLTIAICTHNRPTDVRECIESIFAAERPYSFCDLLIIDSGSHSDAAAELKDIARAYEGIRHIRVEKPGLSRARNIAAANCSSEWLCYLDDDVLIDPKWHQAVSAALAVALPTTAAIGGKIVPQYPLDANTSHVTDRWKLMLSCTDDPEGGSVEAGKNICGANIIFRKSTLQLVGSFSENIGRIGDKLISGEEAEVLTRFGIAGFNCWYVPTFSVNHKIPKARLTKQWIAQRAFWEGYSQVLINKNTGKQDRHLNRLKLTLSVIACQSISILNPSNVDWLIRRQFAIGALKALIHQ